ncbi:galactose-binding domain-like protein [Lasiosphaeris hirsuta]|uniref:Galactose-binding domain-like protein n=1 Tax=Lasiosphaeris hirsuta TaxID=260670 RepID=A0AA40EBH3_9PEZI|nr:galactose-binding domain-like protein [Lasiosphaeris hirsuta]
MAPVKRGFLGSVLDRLYARGLSPETSNYTIERLRIPIADNVRIAADLYRPLGPNPVGTIFVRSPYSINLSIVQPTARIFAARGYQVLLSSCRGTSDSEGDFDPARNEAGNGQAVFAWMKEQPQYTGSARLLPLYNAVPLLDAVNKYFGSGAPEWIQDMITHTDLSDSFWQPMWIHNGALEQSSVPILLTTGWYGLTFPEVMEQCSRLLSSSGWGKREPDTALATRPDTFVFTTAPLPADLAVIGKPLINLHHASDHPYVDILVLLSEVQSGVSYSISERYLRLDPVRAQGRGADPLLSLALRDCAHVFRMGNRIRLLIAGCPHPQYIRNLGTGENPGPAPTCAPRGIPLSTVGPRFRNSFCQ